ncbi:hypothetical protein JCM11491_006960 [Sporobolomyces phaffii]
MAALRHRLESALASRQARGMLRSLAPLAEDSDEPPLVDFSSNDYLSFAQSPLLRAKLIEALADPSKPSPFGPPSSRLLDGNSRAHLELEHALAAFFRAPNGGALVFNSGFDANVGVWTSLPGPNDLILYDSLVHASIHDGMRASRVPRSRRIEFRHNSLPDLESQLDRVRKELLLDSTDASVWIAVESLYSMDGDQCPLEAIVDLVERKLPPGTGHVVVDEAHSTGLYGDQGRGLVSALGLEDRVAVRLHTFGKALACSGAVVLATPLIRQYLVNYARPLIYSTVTPHMNVQAMACAIEMLAQGHGDGPRRRVHQLASLLVSSLGDVLGPGSPVSLPRHLVAVASSSSSSRPHSRSSRVPTTSSIVPLLTASPRPLSAFLRERGYLVRPITYPTVPRGMERVRVCLHAGNSRDEILGLVDGVRAWIERDHPVGVEPARPPPPPPRASPSLEPGSIRARL